MDAPASSETLRQLEEFFAELGVESKAFAHRGVRCESKEVGQGVDGLWYGLLGRASHLDVRGTHIKIWLPLNWACDLRMESRRSSSKGEDDQDPFAVFDWSAANKDFARRRLQGPLLELLARLSSQCHLTMTDDFIQIGPLSGTPAESAELLAELIEVVPRPERAQANSSAVHDPEQQPVVVALSTSRTEVDLWQSKLAAAKIASQCIGYDHSAPWGAATPPVDIRLLVHASDLERAKQVLGLVLDPANQTICHQCGETLAQGAEWCPECRVRVQGDAPWPAEKL